MCRAALCDYGARHVFALNGDIRGAICGLESSGPSCGVIDVIVECVRVVSSFAQETSQRSWHCRWMDWPHGRRQNHANLQAVPVPSISRGQHLHWDFESGVSTVRDNISQLEAAVHLCYKVKL